MKFSEEKIPVFVIQVESKDIFYNASLTEHSTISRDNSQFKQQKAEKKRSILHHPRKRNKSLIFADFTHHSRVSRSNMLMKIEGDPQSRNPGEKLANREDSILRQNM